MPCAFSQIGFTTTVLEAVATAVGAGIVLGGFLVGVVGLARGWTRADLERRVLRDSYIGGLLALLLVAIDLLVRVVV